MVKMVNKSAQGNNVCWKERKKGRRKGGWKEGRRKRKGVRQGGRAGEGDRDR